MYLLCVLILNSVWILIFFVFFAIPMHVHVRIGYRCFHGNVYIIMLQLYQ